MRPRAPRRRRRFGLQGLEPGARLRLPLRQFPSVRHPSAPLSLRAADLPQRFTQHHGGRDRDIQRAQRRPDRNAHAGIGGGPHRRRVRPPIPARQAKCRRAHSKNRDNPAPPWSRAARAAVPRLSARQRKRRSIVPGEIDIFEIVHAGAAEGAIGHRKARRRDERGLDARDRRTAAASSRNSAECPADKARKSAAGPQYQSLHLRRTVCSRPSFWSTWRKARIARAMRKSATLQKRVESPLKMLGKRLALRAWAWQQPSTSRLSLHRDRRVAAVGARRLSGR